ncbi:NUDIX domain-containing protein [Rhodohalobacter barkolensis]|uniref:NUDIX domain-containing protein n=1 Tax=Rhodohalobacter barkolensis TaxID=2053187 RepID=UPI0013FD7535|nr:NUDIX hydrolase [Rhodohalobacter barkolensis]
MTHQDPYSNRIRVRACGILVVEEKILLVEQNVPARKHPVWIPPGGGVRTGESAEDALTREFFEETNLRISGLKLKYINEYIQNPYHAMELYFLVESYSGELKPGYDPEHTQTNQLIRDVRFIPFSELKHIQIVPEFIRDELNSKKYLDDQITFYKSEN